MTSDTSLPPVSPLRARMIEDMTVRGFSEKTRNDLYRPVARRRHSSPQDRAANLGNRSGPNRHLDAPPA
jgi:hypothetical protein